MSTYKMQGWSQFTIRLKPDERDKIKALAESNDQSLSKCARAILIRAIEDPNKPHK
jgi:predicted transcriptional regulator